MKMSSAYRFCRTDDIGLLVEALNRCGNEPPMTPAAFKRWIRDLQVWCSSCMVAFSADDPVGVLIGAKRSGSTLVHRLVVHPDHRRQGHGRHLLTSLGSKLAILGPPRIVAEVPDALAPARALFNACGYVEEGVLTDYVWCGDQPLAAARVEGYVIPFSVDDMAANGLLDQDAAVCWQRSVETLTARKDEVEGLAVASDERIDACILYIKDGLTWQLVWFRSFFGEPGTNLRSLLARLGAEGARAISFPRVGDSEMSGNVLEALGFRATGRHQVYAATLQ